MPVPVLADIADPDPTRARTAFLLVAAPAVTDRHHAVVASHVHGVRRCPEHVLAGAGMPAVCVECGSCLDGLLDAAFRKLRRTLSPDLAVATAPAAALAAAVHDRRGPGGLDAAEVGRLLRRTTRPGRARKTCDPDWLWGLYFRVIHVPAGSLSADLRRSLATRRGMAARPDRDLTTAAWAAPLRADPVGLDLMVSHLVGLRDRVRDPWNVGAAAARHGVAEDEASRLLAAALRRLREVNPGYHAANVEAPAVRARVENAEPLHEQGDLGPNACLWPPRTSGADQPGAASRRRARAALHRITTGPGRTAGHAADIAARLCEIAAGDASTADLRRHCARALHLEASCADRLVQVLTRLIARAGVDWTADLLAGAPGNAA